MTSTKLALTDLLALPNSLVKIPRLGFGVYASHGKQCTISCLTALKTGYRHIDTAQYYGNEKEVGEAVRQSGLPRSEIFITTKVLHSSGSVEKTYANVLNSVKKIDGESGLVDLFLVHTADGGKEARRQMWLALEKLHDQGKVRSIGVSNWGIGHIEEMKEYAKIWPPHVNQIELHPWCQQGEIDAYCQKHGIIVEAYTPLVRNKKDNDPTLMKVAQVHGKSTAQILIRYALQKNWVPLPKSDTPSRIFDNANVYDFELSKDDMETLNGLDKGPRGAVYHFVRNTL